MFGHAPRAGERAKYTPLFDVVVLRIYLVKCGRHSTRHKRSFDVVVIVARKGVFQIQLVVTGRTCAPDGVRDLLRNYYIPI